MRVLLVHRTDRLDRVDASRRGRIPVTSPARTLLDLGAVVPAGVVEAAVGGSTFSDKGNVLVARGRRVMHFTWGDVRREPGYVVDAVARELVPAWPA